MEQKIKVEEYDDDEDGLREVADKLENIRRAALPYQKWIVIPCFIILCLLAMYIAYIYGSAKVCDDLDGVLDKKLVCHLGLNPEPVKNEIKYDKVGMPMNINISLEPE